MSTARTIDLWTGLGFALLGLLGLFSATGGYVLGVISTTSAMAMTYLLTAAVLLYGYFSSDQTAHAVSAVLGLIYAALGIIGFFSASFLGLPTAGWNIVLNLIAAAVLVYDWLGTPRVTA
ncbi:MAG: DUF4383 domain-containing protein [Thermaceae bacterium]|nr:DUF4383 domain-containing protein [Thermaceae bacterium]